MTLPILWLKSETIYVNVCKITNMGYYYKCFVFYFFLPAGLRQGTSTVLHLFFKGSSLPARSLPPFSMEPGG